MVDPNGNGCTPPPLLVLRVGGVGEHETECEDEWVLVPPLPAMEMCSGSGSGPSFASTSTPPKAEPGLTGSASMPISLGLGYHLAPQAKMNTAAAGYMADPRESVPFNGTMPVEGSSSASPIHGHGHATTGSSSAVTTTATLVAGKASPPLALQPNDLPMEHIDHTQLQPLPITTQSPPNLTQTSK